jgi:Peptidase family S41
VNRCQLTLRPWFLGALLLCGTLIVSSATANPPLTHPATANTELTLLATDLQADVALLRRTFETLHPGLLRYNTVDQVDAAFKALEDEFASDRTLAQAYLAFSVFTAKLKCGHTYPNFFNQSKDVATALFQAPRLPFYFCWLDDRMIVTRSFTQEKLIRAGTEIEAINGVPGKTILERLMTVARADGNNEPKRRAYLQVEGTSRYEAFDIYWPLFFPSSAPVAKLSVRDPDQNGATLVDVPLMSYSDRLAVITQEAANGVEKDAPLWSFRLLDSHTGYLSMPSWVLYRSSWNWQAYLDETFESLVTGGATDLVIDLRGNEGGNNVGDVLVSHLVTMPVPRQAVNRLVRYRKLPDDLSPYLNTWDPTFKDWGMAAIDSTDRFYRLRRSADDDAGGVIQPALPRFSGKVWILIGAQNSSATFEFAQTIRQNQLGTLVGQTTGGNLRGINGGAFFFLRLPRSGIEIDVPLIGQFPDYEPPDAGLQPDILITPTVEDIASGRDAELEAVRNMQLELRKK